MRYTGLSFLDASGAPKSVIRGGEPLTLRLHYRCERQTRNPHFGVMVSTDLGTLVAHLNTWSEGFELATLTPGEGWLDLSIAALNMMPGRYPLTLWIQQYGESFLDLLEHCAVFDVHPGGAKGGRTLERRAGLVFFGCSWKHGT